MIGFDQLERPLQALLEEFGPPRKSPHPELPFYHLQSDGVWEIDETAPLVRRQGSKNPLRTELRKWRVTGGFPKEIFDELTLRPEAVRELAREILAAHFPESLHHGIVSAVGLDLESTARNNRRDAEFRRSVVAAWGHCCVFCGYAVQLDNADLALEAAHIRWCQFGGPDTTDNGLACCSIHHQAFDRGAITVSDHLKVLVSSRVHGGGRLEDLFLALHGRALPAPSLKRANPKATFLEWHRAQVFRGTARS